MSSFKPLYKTLFAILLSIHTSVSAGALTSLPGAQTGYIIIDINTGNTVVSRLESTAFIPASTLKCVTAATALSRLGRDFTFETRVGYTGHIESDTLHGALLITGSGDPSIDNSFPTKIHDYGISHIDGFIDISTSEPYVNKSFMIEDIGTDYGVGWAKFNYRANRALINEDMELFPSSYITDDFTADLWTEGITIDNNLTEPTDTTPLFAHTSKPLPKLLHHMLVESDNLYAEAIGRALSQDLSLSSALDTTVSFLSTIGISPKRIRMTDFSGLSRTNLITPRDLARILMVMANNKDYVSSFPLAGREGTVKRLLDKTRLSGCLALKSGSMTGVLAYAGYKLDKSGKPTHVIVIMVNNALCRQSDVKQYIAQWLLKNF